MGSFPFGVMKWLELIWKSDLPPNSKYIASYLRTFMNEKNDMAWPSYSRITTETGLSKSTVAKYLSVLEESGWLLRERGNSKLNTRYFSNIPQKVTDEIIKNVSQGSAPDELGSARGELRSAPDGLGVVRETDTNKQYNNQTNKQEVKKSPKAPCEFHLEIIKAYHDVLPELTKVIPSLWPESTREKDLKARIKMHDSHSDINFWLWLFSGIRKSDWHMGRVQRFKADLGWILKKTNFIKMVEMVKNQMDVAQ